MCKINMSKPHLLEDQIRLYVFDLVDLSGEKTQDERFTVMKKLFRDNYGQKGLRFFDRFQYEETDKYRVKMCDYTTAKSIEEVKSYHDEVSQEDFEGVIIRARELKYSSKKSLQMRKYKHFLDGEFPIMDAIVDPGVGEENFVWICIDPDVVDKRNKKPVQFRVKQSGVTEEERVRLYRSRHDYIGMRLTVSYQERSDDGVPRFPIGVSIRDDQ